MGVGGAREGLLDGDDAGLDEAHLGLRDADEQEALAAHPFLLPEGEVEVPGCVRDHEDGEGPGGAQKLDHDEAPEEGVGGQRGHHGASPFRRWEWAASHASPRAVPARA